MSKYVYAIVSNKTNQLLLQDSKLPFYWNRKIANERVEHFEDHRVVPVLLEDILAVTLKNTASTPQT